jgi:four helix bundle protein
MARIERFEDIIAWQKARELNKKIYSTTGKAEFSRDFDLARQIRRASISVLSNIAEGFERGRPKEFIYFLNVAKASSAEVRAQLYVATDLNYITEQQAEELISAVSEISKMISGLIKYLQSQSPNQAREDSAEYLTATDTFSLFTFKHSNSEYDYN